MIEIPKRSRIGRLESHEGMLEVRVRQSSGVSQRGLPWRSPEEGKIEVVLVKEDSREVERHRPVPPGFAIQRLKG
jgi:hypothetical protein